MTFHPLRELLRKRPFRPSRLAMSDGRVHEIRHPDLAFLTQHAILVGTELDGDGIADRVKTCHLPDVDAVEPVIDPMVYP